MRVTHHRVGMAVYTRYTARYHKRLLARPPADGSSAVRLEVPFPRGTVEARDVFLHFSTQAGRREPEGVTYGLDGIRWMGALPEDPTVVEVEFVTQGREVFEYSLPAARRARSVEVDLRSLRASVEGLAARRQRTAATPAEAAHCIACGHRVSATPYCPQCGTRQPAHDYLPTLPTGAAVAGSPDGPGGGCAAALRGLRRTPPTNDRRKRLTGLTPY